jgi:predicted molibdopterin-dependent oxidoreductase YjgC
MYCRFEHTDGRPIRWEELLKQGAITYGGVGQTRYLLDYDHPAHAPFRDVFRRPHQFTFFAPKDEDLAIPEGIILNTGRSSLSDDRQKIRFATNTYNSGKATPSADMPDEQPLHVSPLIAARHGLQTGDFARISNPHTGQAIVWPVVVSDRVVGETVYVCFHKSRAQLEENRYINEVTSHEGRCPYCSQTSLKTTRVHLERVEAPHPAASLVEVATV